MTETCLPIVNWLKSWFKPRDEDYFYDMSVSDYNPTIDSTVTVGVFVTDGNNSPVHNHTFRLRIGDSTSVTLTTDSEGYASYTHTCSDWGVCRFSVKSYSTHINVTGQKIVKKGSNWSGVDYTLYVDEANRNATLSMTLTNKNIASGTSNYEMTGWIPSKYRPHSQKFIQGYRGNNNLFYVFYDGRIGVANLTSSTQTNVTISAQIDWNY